MDGDLATGLALLRRGEAAAALEPLRRAGPDPLARLNLGLALMDLGRAAEAAPVLEGLAAEGASHPELSFRLGLLALHRGDAAAGRRHLRAARAARPDHPPTLAALARTLADDGEAAALLREAIRLAPDDPALRLELAERDAAEAGIALLLALPDHGRAGLLHARAAPQEGDALGALPPSCAVACARATWLEAAGETEAALAQWRLAAVLNPADPAAAAGLAELLEQLARHAEAAKAYRAAIALDPHRASLRVGLSTALYRQYRLAEGEGVLRQALEELGPVPALRFNLANMLCAQARQDEAMEIARALPDDVSRDLLLLAALGPYAEGQGEAAALADAARSLAARLGPAPPRPPRAVRPDGRLRVGLLSAAFGRHPVGWLTLAGLEHLPRDGFHLVACSLRERDDPLTQRFRAVASEWHELPPTLSDEALAAALRALDLDILLDLSGHGENGRVMALRHRPARVQVKWVGSQAATTGVPGVDWMLSDARETPPGFEAHYTERLLRLPDGYVCYDPPPYAPPVAELPALARGHLTFGCFNSLQKVTRGTRRAWGEILRAVPGARLVLRTHALGDAPTRDAFRALAAADGIPEDRLELLGPARHDALLAAYGEVDVALDPFPYSGGLTVCESLWMGVPVVARAGTHFAGRHALSHLTSAGLADWVAEDAAGYVRRAVAAAGDLAALAALRAGMRARLRASPLLDGPRFGANLAAALRRAFEEA